MQRNRIHTNHGKVTFYKNCTVSQLSVLLNVSMSIYLYTFYMLTYQKGKNAAGCFQVFLALETINMT